MRRIASARKLFKKPARIRYVVGERFRDMRLTCGLSLDACAKLLRVSVRTVLSAYFKTRSMDLQFLFWQPNRSKSTFGKSCSQLANPVLPRKY